MGPTMTAWNMLNVEHRTTAATVILMVIKEQVH